MRQQQFSPVVVRRGLINLLQCIVLAACIIGDSSAFAPILDSSRGLAARPGTFSLVDYMNGPVLSASTLDAPTRTASPDRQEEEKTQVVSSSMTNAITADDNLRNNEQEPPLQVEEAVPTTMSGAIRRFFFGRDVGPVLVVGAISSFIHSRLTMLAAAPLSMTDLAVFASAIVYWWFQEHIMHGALLHSNFDWMGKRIHQAHHERNYFHVSIDSAELILGWLATVHVLLRFALPLPLALSATIGYASAGLFYEWAHYIVHTKVKPKKGSFMAKMRDNHIRHHQINHRYWLAFSVPGIDDLFGTNPSVQQARAEQQVE